MKNVLLKVFAVIIIFLFLVNTASADVSLNDAVGIASEYAENGEIAAAPFPIYKNDHLYYKVDFYHGTNYAGLIVIDGVSGKVVRDEKKAEDILFAKYLYENCSVEELQSFLEISNAFEVYAVKFREQAEKDFNLSKTVDPDLTADFENLSFTEQTLSNDFFKLSALFENLSIIERDILNGTSHELAEEFFKKCDGIVNQLEKVADELLEVRIILTGICAKVKDPENKKNVEKYLNYVEGAEDSTRDKAEKIEEEFNLRKSAIEEKVENALVYIKTRGKKEEKIPIILILMIIIPVVVAGMIIGPLYKRRKKYKYVKKWRK